MIPGSKVFCVEDDHNVAKVLEQQLEYLGYKVCGIAKNAPAALEGIGKSNPDFALVDIELEGNLGGLDVGNFLITETDIPFVYMTAHEEQEVLDKARQTLPDGFLLKPFDTRQLRVAMVMAQRVD